MNEFIIKNGLIVSGSTEIGDNLIVHGTLTANQYNVSVISSSILYESGSTKFGDSSDDTHEFTGSLNISGSILLNGATVGTGKLDETTFESFTSSYLDVSSSLDGRVGDLESFSSSLDNSFVSETEFGSYTSSINGRVDDLETESGSIRGDFNSFTSSYTNVSTSIDSRLDTLETLSGSFTGSFSGSFTGDGTNLYNIPASGVTGLNLTQIADGSVTASVSNTNGLRVNSKTEITGSLIVTDGITGSIDYSNITNKPTLVSGSSQIDITSTTGYSTFSSSVSSSIGELSASVATMTNDLDSRLDNIETSTGSLNSFTSSIDTTIKNKLNTDGVISGSSQVTISDTTGFSEFSSSISSSVTTIFVDNIGQDNRLDDIETSTGSLNSFTSSIDTTIKNKLNTEGVISGSIQVNLPDVTGYSTFSSSVSSSIGLLSSSVAVTDLNQNDRLNSLEGKSGSYATTGSNTFNGSQIISGSVIIRENLTVLGSSSITYTTSSQLRVDDNVIVVNTSNPAERFGGLQVYDSGSVGEATGSLFWDSQKNRWVYQQSSESTYGGGVLLSGPRSSGSLGDELTLTSGKIARSDGGDHLNDSIITEYGATTIGINGGLEITGSIVSTVTPLVSGSLQINITDVTNYTTFSSSISSSVGSLSSSIATTDLNQNNRLGSLETMSSSLNSFTSSINTTIKNKLNADGVLSGSVAIANGGTGATTAAGARTNLGLVIGTDVLAQRTFGTAANNNTGDFALYNATHYVGTTAITANRASASQTLTGVSIDGSAATVLDTNIGSIAGPLSTTTTAAGWAQPSGFNKMVMSSGSSGLPSTGAASPYYGYTVLSRRDAASGYSGILIGYNNDEMWFTYNTVGSNYATWKRVWHEGNLTNLNQLTNGPGYITGITSGNVTTALGYTPYNSTNPNGYISGISFANVSSKPTTISGYGITDAITTSNIGSQSVNYASTAGNITSYTINQNVGSGNSPSFVDINLSGGLTVGGSLSRGTYTVGSNFVSGADNIVLKGNSSGVSGIYFESEKDGTSINYPSDFGFIQFHPYGVGGSTGEQNRLVIGVSNDSDDMIVLNPVGSDGVKVRVGTGTTEYTVYHSGNIPTWNQNTTGTASNITSYTINQSVGTGNSPTFAGITLSGPIYRSAAGTGYLNGNYSSVETPSTSGAIYTIGGSYVPGTTSLGNMFGIGYGNAGGTAIQMTGAAGWGMYVAGNGTIGVFLAGEGQASVFKGHIVPHSNNSYNLGSATYGWANVYTNDLHLSNMNKPEGNDIDGTSGTWTIQEGAENLYIINNRNGKKFKISLEEI